MSSACLWKPPTWAWIKVCACITSSIKTNLSVIRFYCCRPKAHPTLSRSREEILPSWAPFHNDFHDFALHGEIYSSGSTNSAFIAEWSWYRFVDGGYSSERARFYWSLTEFLKGGYEPRKRPCKLTLMKWSIVPLDILFFMHCECLQRSNRRIRRFGKPFLCWSVLSYIFINHPQEYGTWRLNCE